MKRFGLIFIVSKCKYVALIKNKNHELILERQELREIGHLKYFGTAFTNNEIWLYETLKQSSETSYDASGAVIGIMKAGHIFYQSVEQFRFTTTSSVSLWAQSFFV